MARSKTIKAFKAPYTPTPEQLEKAVKRIKQFLSFAEDYLHSGHYSRRQRTKRVLSTQRPLSSCSFSTDCKICRKSSKFDRL